MSEYENKQFEDTGFETPTTNAMVSEKSKIVAAVLAFFLYIKKLDSPEKKNNVLNNI